MEARADPLGSALTSAGADEEPMTAATHLALPRCAATARPAARPRRRRRARDGLRSVHPKATAEIDATLHGRGVAELGA